ncbi:MAG: NADH-quinone oxidoreductase subunit M, partial [Thiohalocapsa sp.]
MLPQFPWLTLVIWLPIIGGLAVIANGDKNAEQTKRMALGVAVATFVASLPLWLLFEPGTAAMQFVERADWIPAIKVQYYLGVDGISMPLILLTTFVTIFVIIAGWEVVTYRPSYYMGAFLIMEGIMVGVFSALDAILFYFFWEAMLIPMFIIIGVWGGPNRVYATIKFFLYTFFGSVFMLVALIYMYFQADSFSIPDFHGLQLGMTAQVLIFFAFLIAFAVKVPMFPVHTWLPDAHVEAPTGGS